ncbi:MAG: DinB family protein [Pyrinomonadaceae bacterium]
MKYESIGDIFSANQKFRDGLVGTLGAITPGEASLLAPAEGWTIQQIAEHVSIVDTGIARICTKLLGDSLPHAESSAAGAFSLSTQFGTRAAEMGGLRVEAPDQVKPTGNVSVADSIKIIEDNRHAYEAMRADFEHLDFSGATFPHPFFGPLTAGEWLVMSGLHKYRHTKQIASVAEKIRNEKIPGQKEGNPAGDETSN